MNRKLGLVSALVILSAFSSAQRAPTASYTVSGAAGNWDLNFTLQSHFNAGEGDFYVFGVFLSPGSTIDGSPGIYGPNPQSPWNNATYGGSNTNYNVNWIDFSGTTGPTPGAYVSGFVAHTTDVVAPTSVQFYAFSDNGTYGGTDYINFDFNPGFEGVAVNGVPEPASLTIFAVGSLMMIRRRRK
ncbi:MAG: PEP-CTERM sorting domain-containing protein [Armatimonadetes bacterium]|nr:PEP-CTERM sorting domain-containing protein [Armatimonadota bacterium]